MLSQTARWPFFLWLNNVLLHPYSTFSLFIHPSTDTRLFPCLGYCKYASVNRGGQICPPVYTQKRNCRITGSSVFNCVRNLHVIVQGNGGFYWPDNITSLRRWPSLIKPISQPPLQLGVAMLPISGPCDLRGSAGEFLGEILLPTQSPAMGEEAMTLELEEPSVPRRQQTQT